jgi:hypothetical protein
MGPSGFPDYPTCIGIIPEKRRCSLWRAVYTAVYTKYLSGILLHILKSSTSAYPGALGEQQVLIPKQDNIIGGDEKNGKAN